MGRGIRNKKVYRNQKYCQFFGIKNVFFFVYFVTSHTAEPAFVLRVSTHLSITKYLEWQICYAASN